MTTVSTPHYLLDQARRRLTPTLNTMPGLGVVDKRLRTRTNGRSSSTPNLPPAVI